MSPGSPRESKGTLAGEGIYSLPTNFDLNCCVYNQSKNLKFLSVYLSHSKNIAKK